MRLQLVPMTACPISLSLARPRRPGHRMRPHLHASKTNQHLNRPCRPAPRNQRSRRRHLDRQLHELRSRLHRSGAKNLATPRQPVRPEVVTHVLGTECHLCLRAGHEISGSPSRTRTCDHSINSHVTAVNRERIRTIDRTSFMLNNK
jgi:hypothetical protein